MLVTSTNLDLTQERENNMKWWRYIYDNRLPRGCRLFPVCLSCMVYCYGKKLHEKEILCYDRAEETRKVDTKLRTCDKFEMEKLYGEEY